jgi:phage/plasmid-associated DNA primase
VFIKIIESLLDEESVSHLEVINMFDKELDALNGKLLNVSTELESNAMVNKGQISVIKKIVAGEPIQINPKFDDSYVLRRPPKLIMSGNEKLKGGGLNDGLTRRMILVPFEQTIPANEMDEDLERKIIENELPAVLNWAIEGLLRLVKNKYKFTKAQSIEDAMEEYRVETDQIYSYIKECFGQYENDVPNDAALFRRVYDVNLIFNERIKIPTSFLYQHYVEWAKESGINPMQQRNFTTKLGEKLKVKTSTHRIRAVHVSKGYANGDAMTMTYPAESKPLKCIAGFSVISDIKINVNGMPLTLMETILQGAE